MTSSRTRNRAGADTGGMLVELATHLGIQPRYVDASGNLVEAREHALLSAVRALHPGVTSIADVPGAMRQLARERATVVIEPVHVAWRGTSAMLQTGPAMPADAEFELVLEDGTRRSLAHPDGHAPQLPGDLPMGYHDLHVLDAGGEVLATSRVICAPEQVYAGDLQRAWGIFLPLYAARSAGDWGIGDTATARAMLDLATSAGGRLYGSTPMLATFLGDDPFEPSPYAPVSRLFWNESHLAVDELAELGTSAAARDLVRDRSVLRERERLRGLAHVDHHAVYALKRRVLDACADAINDGIGNRRSQLDAWCAQRPLVDEYAEFRARVEGSGERGARTHRYAQWAMEQQLGELAERPGAGLYLDLPLGVHPDGFDRARFAPQFVDGVSVGAPPDPLAPGGQDWGLPPLHPQRSRAAGHDYTIAAVQHVMRHAAAVRVDHVMGLHRLFWIPTELDASDGVYVQTAADEHWAIICLESHRNRCAVVGEDLGTVPPEVGAAMQRHHARRSYVLQFAIGGEGRDVDPAAGGAADAAIAPAPAGSLASVNTHDTPMWAAAWGALDEPARRRTVDWLRERGHLDDTVDAEAQLADPVAVHAAALREMAIGDASAVLVNVEDLWGELEPQNVPGTTSAEAPNWVRRATFTVEEMGTDPSVVEQLRELDQLRAASSASASVGAHRHTSTVRHDLFLPTAQDVYLFAEGTHSRLHRILGSHVIEHDGLIGTYFSVWAPNAERVSVICTANGWTPGAEPLKPDMGGTGIWFGWIPGIRGGEHYKYHITTRDSGYQVEKADPFARHAELPPRTASIVCEDEHEWRDDEWMRTRGAANSLDAPISVYELHAGSWMRVPEEGGRMLTWDELAPRLIEHVQQTGFTHVQLMPVMEHPFSGSWGYQTTGYFAPTSRHGTYQQFQAFVDALHRAGIGVLLDWVPSHFPEDLHGLARFDGTHLYEHADPRQGFHPDWKSAIFNYSRNEVRSFLRSSALYWLEEHHVDGLRVDAVASMLYLDYSREEGEWIPNEYGGRENLAAIDLLRGLNTEAYASFPDIMMIAEESTAWGGISRPVETGGIGFGMKWDMGWMHDTLQYLAREPVHRRYHQDELSFRQLYAYTENFMLPLSHDEVVHGKGSLLQRMPGDDWQKFANLRLLLAYMWMLPGKKLLFMGGELAQRDEWDHDSSIDWHLLQHAPHRGVQQLVADLNHIYRDTPALHELDHDAAGFEWIDASDAENSIYAFVRRGRGTDAAPVVVVLNATPTVRHEYRVGVPSAGRWRELLNTDAHMYWGGGQGNAGGVEADDVSAHGRPCSLSLTLPPLSVLVLQGSD